MPLKGQLATSVYPLRSISVSALAWLSSVARLPCASVVCCHAYRLEYSLSLARSLSRHTRTHHTHTHTHSNPADGVLALARLLSLAAHTHTHTRKPHIHTHCLWEPRRIIWRVAHTSTLPIRSSFLISCSSDAICRHNSITLRPPSVRIRTFVLV